MLQIKKEVLKIAASFAKKTRKKRREYDRPKYHIFEVLYASFNSFVQARIPAWGRIGTIDVQGSLRDQESP